MRLIILSHLPEHFLEERDKALKFVLSAAICGKGGLTEQPMDRQFLFRSHWSLWVTPSLTIRLLEMRDCLIVGRVVECQVAGLACPASAPVRQN